MREMKTTLAICLLLFSVAIAGAEQPASLIAIHAGRLIDVQTGNVRQDVYILVRGERIDGVAASAPADATVIDLSRATVLPGLIDCHVHLLFNWKDLSVSQGLRLSSPAGVLWGLHNG